MIYTQTRRYHGHRFPAEIISLAVWLYNRFCLSFRHVEDLLAERVAMVMYQGIRRWCLKFGPAYARTNPRTDHQNRAGTIYVQDSLGWPKTPRNAHV